MATKTKAGKKYAFSSLGGLQKIFSLSIIVIMLVLLVIIGIATQNSNKYGYKSRAMIGGLPRINIPTIAINTALPAIGAMDLPRINIPTIAINTALPAIGEVAPAQVDGNILNTLLGFLNGQVFQNIFNSLLKGGVPEMAPSSNEPTTPNNPAPTTAVEPLPVPSATAITPVPTRANTVNPTPTKAPTGVCQVIDPWGKSSDLKVGVSQCSCVMGICAQATCSTCNSTSPCVCKPNSMPSDAGNTLPCTNNGGLFIKKVSKC